MKKNFIKERFKPFSNTNLLRKMKLVVFFVAITICHLSATNSYAQKTEITLKMNNATLREAIRSIEKQTEFVFFYSNDKIDLNKKVSFNIENGTINDILDLISDDYAYIIENKQVLLIPKSSQVSKRITGIITDPNGEPIIGANILVEGTTIGTITDMNGEFELTVPQSGTLKVSYIGYLNHEEKISGKTNYQIVLREDSQALDEVVVVGYGVQKRSELTGAIASVKSDDIKDVSAKSLSEALSGRVAGVMVTKSDGKPGEKADIIIRGAGSVNGLGPLYIVDGVRMGTEFNFNMRDVESIEILKDAGSSAIYGAQAAGGVILITTKRGKASDKMKIDINARFGVRNAVTDIKMLGKDDYVTAYKNIGIDILALEGKTLDALPNTNWMDEIYGTGREQEYNVSLSGGSDKYNYFLSGGYYREDGIYVDNWQERFSLRTNSDYKVGKHLTIGESLYGSFKKKNPLRDEALASLPLRSAPTMEIYDPTNLGGWAKTPSYLQGSNPLGSEKIYHYKNDDYTIEGNIYGDLMIIEGLNARVTLGGAFGGWSERKFTEAYDFGVNKNNQAQMESKSKTWKNLTGNATLTYSKTFGDHSLKVMAGWEALRNDSYEMWVQAVEFSIPVSESLELSTNPDKKGGDSPGIGRTLSYFGRINYGYKGKYLITANIRRDGSDKFGNNNRWGTFPSVNGAWRISEESFVKDYADWLSNAKLRASWGILGNDGIDQYLYQAAFKQLNLHNYGGDNRIQGWSNTKFPNQDIKWEEVNQTDIGIDLGFFKNKLTITYDWYNRQTKDMLYMLNLPLSAGIGGYNDLNSKVPINIGQVENIGSEITVNWQDTRNDFYYSVGANFSFNKNKVVKIGEEGAILSDGGVGAAMAGAVNRTVDGKPMGQFWGYNVLGIFETEQQIAEYNAKAVAAGAPGGFYQKSDTKPGDLIYDDLGQGYISEDSKTFIGNPWPKMVYGINIDLAYKGFDISLLFQGAAGVDIYNATKAYTQHIYGDYNSTKDVFKNSFFGNNGLTKQPRSGYFDENNTYVRDPNGNYQNISSYYVEKGDYLKLKNLSIGYTLPKLVSQKVRLENARIYMSAQNLFTITGYSGIDPEIAGKVRERGLDQISRYLPTRLFSFGLDLTF